MRAPTFILCLLAALAPAFPAAAHVFLARADPRVGAVVAKAPATLRLTFTGPVTPAFSRVTVAGPPGFGGAAPARPAANDRASLTVDLRAPAPAGTYVVHWRAMAADTHVTEGDYQFRIEP
jgi:methionine-rich copper-binding protein CopC